MLPLNRNPSPKQLRSFSKIWLPLFIAFLGTLLWKRHENLATTVWIAGGLLSLAAMVSDAVARVTFVTLMTVTYPVGFVVSLIALALIYYGMFVPLGLALRLGGRDPLRLRARANDTHWVKIANDERLERAFRQY